MIMILCLLLLLLLLLSLLFRKNLKINVVSWTSHIIVSPKYYRKFLKKIILKIEFCSKMGGYQNSNYINSIKLPGFAAARTDVREFRIVVIPCDSTWSTLAVEYQNGKIHTAFAIEMVCCSMASWIATRSYSYKTK